MCRRALGLQKLAEQKTVSRCDLALPVSRVLACGIGSGARFRLHQGREALLAWSLESVVFGGDFTYFLAFGIAG